MLVHLPAGLGPAYRFEAALIPDSSPGETPRGRGGSVTMFQYSPRGFSATLWDLVKLIRVRGVAILHTQESFVNILGLMASRLTEFRWWQRSTGRITALTESVDAFAYRLIRRFVGQLATLSEDNKRFLAERVGFLIVACK